VIIQAANANHAALVAHGLNRLECKFMAENVKIELSHDEAVALRAILVAAKNSIEEQMTVKLAVESGMIHLIVVMQKTYSQCPEN
jgi:hypothetical protein